jgi:surface antigen
MSVMAGFVRSILTILSVLPMAAGCTVMNGSALEESAVDRTVVTNSVPIVAPAVADALSDSRTVRNAVSAADITRSELQPLAWSNTDTGASGAITDIRETKAGDQTCRTFRTSRQRFDGVSVFAGEACTRGAGEWTLTRFSEGG